MAEGVDSQILALVGADKMPSNSGKVGQFSTKNSDPDAFSRVLDKQRADARAPTKDAPAAAPPAKSADDSGNALPQDEASATGGATNPATNTATNTATSTAQTAETAEAAGQPASAGGAQAGESDQGTAERQARLALNTAVTAEFASRPVAEGDAEGDNLTLRPTQVNAAVTLDTDPRRGPPTRVVDTPTTVLDPARALSSDARPQDAEGGVLARNELTDGVRGATQATNPNGDADLRRLAATRTTDATTVTDDAESRLKSAETAREARGVAGTTHATPDQATAARLATGRNATALPTSTDVQAVEPELLQPQSASTTRSGADVAESAAQVTRNDNAAARDRAATALNTDVSVERSIQDRSIAADTRSPSLTDSAVNLRAGEGASAPTSSSVATAAPAAAPVTSATTSVVTGMERGAEMVMVRAPSDAEFAGEFASKVKVLVRDGVREARIQLHPAELGRLQVTVSTDGDQARVSFVAETAAARDTIEQSLPRLREMLEQNGLQLAQSDVDHGGAAQERAPERGESLVGAEGDESGNDTDGLARNDGVTSPGGTSRIDTYI